MKQNKLYACKGYWINDKQSFQGMIVSDGEWNGLEDAEDEAIFHYTSGEPVVGEHDEFVITEAEIIDWDRWSEIRTPNK